MLIQPVYSTKLLIAVKMRGFTIVELVLVVAMLGILGLTVVVISPSPQPARLTAAARQVQSDIEYAKQNAMMTGQTSGIFFKKFHEYKVYQGTVATLLKSPLTKTDMEIELSTDYPNVKLNNTYTIEFNSFGAPTTGGGGSIQLTDGTNTKTITITANTGMVSIQ